MTRIDLTDVSVALAGRTVLHGLSCEFSGGEIVGVVGPNGAGKSTLLRAIAGLSPYTGSIVFDGRELRSVASADLARCRAFLPQGGGVHWPLTAAAVAELGRFPFGDAQTGIGRAAIERAMRAAGVLEFAERPFPELSGGERARVLLARALAAEARIVLADEPAAQLDPRHALEALSVLRAAANAGAIVVVAMHDLTAASRSCDKVLAMAGGEIRAYGKPSEVLTAEVLQSVFGVDAHIGLKDGVPYVVPLRASA